MLHFAYTWPIKRWLIDVNCLIHPFLKTLQTSNKFFCKWINQRNRTGLQHFKLLHVWEDKPVIPTTTLLSRIKLRWRAVNCTFHGYKYCPLGVCWRRRRRKEEAVSKRRGDSRRLCLLHLPLIFCLGNYTWNWGSREHLESHTLQFLSRPSYGHTRTHSLIRSVTCTHNHMSAVNLNRPFSFAFRLPSAVPSSSSSSLSFPISSDRLCIY